MLHRLCIKMSQILKRYKLLNRTKVSIQKRYEEAEEVMTTFVSKTNADLSEFSDSNDEFLKALREKIDAADNCDEESKINDDDSDNVTETKNYSMLTLFTSSREMTLISANVCFQEEFKHMNFDNS